MKGFLWAGLFCALALWAVTNVGFAQGREAADGADPCPQAQTQFDLNQCAGQRYRQADAELNRVYQELMRAEGGQSEKLKAAQLARIKFRDAQCDYEASGYEGGSMQPMVYSLYLAGATTARTKQLRESLKEVRAER